MICSHCGYDHGLTQVCIKQRVPKVHYWLKGIGAACGARNSEETTDKSRVTCLSCKRTKVFKEA